MRQHCLMCELPPDCGVQFLEVDGGHVGLRVSAENVVSPVQQLLVSLVDLRGVEILLLRDRGLSLFATEVSSATWGNRRLRIVSAGASISLMLGTSLRGAVFKSIQGTLRLSPCSYFQDQLSFFTRGQSDQ